MYQFFVQPYCYEVENSIWGAVSGIEKLVKGLVSMSSVGKYFIILATDFMHGQKPGFIPFPLYWSIICLYFNSCSAHKPSCTSCYGYQQFLDIIFSDDRYM